MVMNAISLMLLAKLIAVLSVLARLSACELILPQSPNCNHVASVTVVEFLVNSAADSLCLGLEGAGLDLCGSDPCRPPAGVHHHFRFAEPSRSPGELLCEGTENAAPCREFFDGVSRAKFAFIGEVIGYCEFGPGDCASLFRVVVALRGNVAAGELLSTESSSENNCWHYREKLVTVFGVQRGQALPARNLGIDFADRRTFYFQKEAIFPVTNEWLRFGVRAAADRATCGGQ